MSEQNIDAHQLKDCLLSAGAALLSKKEMINDLNVFPVPDGDTGTNMSMTFMSALDEVNALEKVTMDELAKAVASGSLKGARGNSGVILSQILRGFTKAMQGREYLDIEALSDSFEKAVHSAYRAVMKPKEGTILTVARAGSEHAINNADNTDDIMEYIEGCLGAMKEALDDTPNLLPVLKEAGVVDSGGMGLYTIVEGAVASLQGRPYKFEDKYLKRDNKSPFVVPPNVKKDLSTGDIKFGYCTEFIVKLNQEFTDKDKELFIKYLDNIGDSIVCVADDEIVKIHVHTDNPGKALQKGLSYGQLSRIKIDNMREEHNERLIHFSNGETSWEEIDESKKAKDSVAKSKQAGFISVSSGKGFEEIFDEMDVDVVINGGQTMNPSTDDITSAIDSIDSKDIYILPNNSNIILAANQAADLRSERNVIVIPTTSVPQGIAALTGFVEGEDSEDNKENMISAMEETKTAEVTYAVRDTSFEGQDIKKGDIMGIFDKKIKAVGKDVFETSYKLISSMLSDEYSLITLYYGEKIEEEEAENLCEELASEFSDYDFCVEYGGQPIYYYLISME